MASTSLLTVLALLPGLAAAAPLDKRYYTSSYNSSRTTVPIIWIIFASIFGVLFVGSLILCCVRNSRSSSSWSRSGPAPSLMTANNNLPPAYDPIAAPAMAYAHQNHHNHHIHHHQDNSAVKYPAYNPAINNPVVQTY